MYSVLVEGKFLDYYFKRMDEFTYAFYIGDILIGQIFKMGKGHWSCVSWIPSKLCPVGGFKSRLYAAQYLLKLNGYRI